MKNLIIIGTGAVAAEWTQYIKDINDIQLKGYLEYDYNIEKYYNQYHFDKPIIGDIDSYIPEADDVFMLGVSHVGFRNKVIKTMKSKGAIFATLVHPTAIIADDAIIGEGCAIGPFSEIGPQAVLGDYNQMTSFCSISHDCKLGRNNSFSSVIVCGHTTIGDDNTFYIKSTVLPDLTIGNRNVIQAGMMVDQNIGDDATIFYRFKERIIAVPKE